MRARHCEHTCQSLAKASVQFPDIISALTRAHDNPGPRRLEELHEAQELCLDVLRDINAAIAKELEAQPAATPTVTRIRDVAEALK